MAHNLIMENDQSSINLEILRMARELVINEYTDRRAEVHNKWLVEAEHLWRSQRLRVAYPTIPPYPTEYDIVERAERLMKFLQFEVVPSTKKIESVTSSTISPVNLTDNSYPKIDMIDIALRLEEQQLTDDTTQSVLVVASETVEHISEPLAEINKQTSTDRVLPSVLKRIQNRFL